MSGSETFQSVRELAPKYQIETLGKGLTLEEKAVLNLVGENNFVKQDELVKRTGKSLIL